MSAATVPYANREVITFWVGAIKPICRDLPLADAEIEDLTVALINAIIITLMSDCLGQA